MGETAFHLMHSSHGSEHLSTSVFAATYIGRRLTRLSGSIENVCLRFECRKTTALFLGAMPAALWNYSPKISVTGIHPGESSVEYFDRISYFQTIEFLRSTFRP